MQNLKSRHALITGVDTSALAECGRWVHEGSRCPDRPGAVNFYFKNAIARSLSRSWNLIGTCNFGLADVRIGML